MINSSLIVFPMAVSITVNLLLSKACKAVDSGDCKENIAKGSASCFNKKALWVLL